MSFRGVNIKRLLLYAALLLPVACGLHIGEKAPPASDLTASSGQFACVGQIGKKAEQFVNNELKENDINVFVKCLQNAFRNFNQYMKGERDRDTFTPEEIRTFIHRLLPPDSSQISDQLLHQFMLIKQNLVGGPLDSITRPDLESAIDILDQIRGEAVRMQPFIPILNPRLLELEKVKDRQLKIPQLGNRIADAQKAAAITGRVFGNILSKSQKPYLIKDLEKFVEEFRQFLKWEEHFPGGHSAYEWVRLAAAFKDTAVAPGKDKITGEQWAPLFRNGVEWYLSYIKYDVAIKDQGELFDGLGLQNVIGLGDQVLLLLNDAVNTHPNQRLPFETVKELFSALEGVKWLPKNIRAESLQAAVRVVVNRIMGDPLKPGCDRAKSDTGVTPYAVSGIKHEFDLWKEIQLALQERYAEDRAEKRKTAETTLPALQVPVAVLDESRAREAWDQFIDKYKGTRPLFKEGHARVFLASERYSNFENGFYNLSKLNIVRAMVNLLFMGYANRTSNSWMDSTISQDQVQTFYENVKGLGQDLGFMDPRTTTAGKRTFLEGKLFTYASDGIADSHPNLTFQQMMQELSFLYSGGNLGRELYNRVRTLCSEGPLDTIFKNPKLDRRCVKFNLTNEMIKEVDTMPGLTAFLGRLDAKQQLKYAQTLMDSAFNRKNLEKEPDGAEYVEMSEFSTMAVIAQYAEAVLTKYDVDPQDEILSEVEVNGALPVFGNLAFETTPLLKQLSSFLPPWILRVLGFKSFAENGFKFVIRYGELPAGEDFLHIFEHTYGHLDQWYLKTDRQGLTQVFATLIQKISEQAAAKSTQTNNDVCK
jgi:hypothetical protein